MPWTASMSSVSSPYQPLASWAGLFGRLKVPGDATCEKLEPFSCGSPLSREYRLTSSTIVGDAYASMTATVWPAPVRPEPATPYAPRSCSGVYPHGAYGKCGPGSVVSMYCAQYVEQGFELRKPADGGASATIRFGWISDCESSSPTTPLTAGASEDGTLNADDGA